MPALTRKQQNDVLERANDTCEWCSAPNNTWRNDATGEITRTFQVAERWIYRQHFPVTYIALSVERCRIQDSSFSQGWHLVALCKECAQHCKSISRYTYSLRSQRTRLERHGQLRLPV